MFATKLNCMRQFAFNKISTNLNKNSINRKHEALDALACITEKLQVRTHYISTTKSVSSNIIDKSITSSSSCNALCRNYKEPSVLKMEKIEFVPIRYAGSYFQKSGKQSDMWKTMTSVSNQGKKRGRAKGLLKIKNLNLGQRLGWGRERIRFPGLTGSNKSVKSRAPHTKISVIGEVELERYQEEVKEAQQKVQGKKRRRKVTPLQRGWTGGNPRGKKFGAPVSLNPDLKFDNFESILVEYTNSMKMTSKFGRQRGVRMIMCTGNRNGTIGYTATQEAFGRGPYVFTRAMNRAGLRLFTVPRYEDRTVYHDFFSNFGQTRVMVLQKPQGYGVKAHRLIKSVCELVGIKDLAVKVEGRINYPHILKSFLLGLLRQRTHQELANEMKLHLVEFRPEIHNFPKVVASPEDGYVRTKEEIKPDEILDFQVISFDGNKPILKPKSRPFYEHLPSWQQRLKKIKPQEHHFQQRIDMLVEHGREQSQYTDIFPECKSNTDQANEWMDKKRAARKQNEADI